MFWQLPVESNELSDALNPIYKRIKESMSHSSFAADVLETRGINRLLMQIQSLTHGAWVTLDTERCQIPGAVYIFEVEVTFKNDELKVIEKVMLSTLSSVPMFLFSFFR